MLSLLPWASRAVSVIVVVPPTGSAAAAAEKVDCFRSTGPGVIATVGACVVTG